MKYHSDFTTAIITIGILLVFALVSVFIISSLDMTSPTLLITQRLFTTLNEANSDIGVSFKNVSRNLQHQIVINELSLTYRGKDFLSFDRITVGTGLFQFLGYFVAKDNPLEIKFHNGKVFISEEMLKEFLPESENDPISAEHGSEFSLDSIRQLIDQDYELTLPSILYDYAFRVAIDSLSLEVENLIKADDTKLSLYWNKGFPDLTFDYQMPEVHVDMDDINIIAEDVSLNGYYTSNLVLNLSFGNTGGSFAGNEAAFKSFSLRISGINESSFSFNDLTVFSEINSISARNQVFSADLDSLTLNSYRGSGDIQLSKPVIEYKGMNVRLSSVSLGFSKLNSVALSLNGFDVRKDSVILAYSPKVDSIFNFDTKEVYLSTENIYTQLPGTITSSFINEVGIENVSLGISYSTNFIDVSFSSPHLYLKSSDAELDDAGADMNLTFRYGNNTLQNIRLVVDQIKYKNSSNSLRLSALGNLEDLTLNLISAGDNSFSLALLLQQDNIRGSLQSKDFLLDTLRPFINNYVPAFSSYISDRTAITGSFGFSFDKNEKAKLKLTGPIDSAIRIDDIHFNRSDFSADIEFEAELEEREFEISNLYFSSEIFDIEFSGKINFDDYLPTGIFRLYGFNDNKLNTFEFSFDLSAYKEYSFLATLPRFDNTYIKGVVNFAEEKRIVSDVYSEIGGNQYPLDLSINLEEKQLVGTSTYMNINASWKEILDFSIRINNLPLSSSGVLAPTRINNSRVDFTFDFANQSFTLDIPSFEIANIEMLPNTPTIKFNLVGNNDELYVENIVISSFNQKDITGSMLLDFQPNSFALNFTDGDNERIYGSVIRYNDRYIGGLRGEHINLERFGFDGFEANINLNGDALTLDEFTFSGKIQAQALDSANDLRIVETSILIDDDRIILSDVVYSNDLMQISSPEISLVSKTGRFEIQEVAIDYNRKNEAGEDLSIHFNMAVSAETEGEDTLLLLLENLVRSKANGLEFQAEVKNFNYASELEIPKASFVGIYNNGKIDFSGEFLNGYVDISSGDMDFYIAADPLISAGIKGNFKNFYGPNLTVTIDGLAVEFTNIFFSKPVVKFYNPSNLTGVVNIVFNEAGLDVFGELYCEYAAMDLFWLTNQTVILHNAKFVIWDN